MDFRYERAILDLIIGLSNSVKKIEISQKLSNKSCGDGKSAEFLIKEYPEYSFIICGSGDQYKDLKLKSLIFKNIRVLGEINKFQAKTLIKNSIATIAPYRNTINFQKSIPNKVIESLENV